MKKLLLIPIVAALTACSGMRRLKNAKTMHNQIGTKTVLKQVLKVGSGGVKSLPMLAAQASQYTHRQLKNRCMLLQ